MESSRPKTIFEFDNYRDLLKHLYAQNKLKNKNFSYRYFSRLAGFVSPNFLKRVMDGESKLSDKSIGKFIKGFKLTREEGHFFRHLVLLNQAVTNDERKIHAQELLRSSTYRQIHPLLETQYEFFSRWYFIPVRELVNFPGFKEEPEWIAKAVIPNITTEQAKTALEALIQLGMLTRESGKLVQTSKKLSTPSEVVSSSLAQCHKEMMKRASESIDRIAREKRDISSVSFCVDKEKIKQIKELIEKFRREVLDLASVGHLGHSVYQLNLQLFPIAESQDGDGSEDLK